MDYADAVHPGIKNQLEYSLKPREEVTQFVLEGNPLGSSEDMWNLRDELYKVLKRKTEATSEARKIVECVEHINGYEAWRLLGVRYEAQGGLRRRRSHCTDPTHAEGVQERQRDSGDPLGDTPHEEEDH